MEEIGEALDEREAVLIVVGEATIERAVVEVTERAKKAIKKEVRADAGEMEKAIEPYDPLQATVKTITSRS